MSPRGPVNRSAVGASAGLTTLVGLAVVAQARLRAVTRTRKRRLVRIVAISPGDVMQERERLAAVVDELNRHVAPAHGCELKLWRYESDAHPGVHHRGRRA